MGGQVSDAGLIEIGGESYHVMAVQQIGNARAHVVEARPGLEVKTGDRVHLSIDAERRRRIEAHHTATHLLHCALHQVVSPDAAQQGPLFRKTGCALTLTAAPFLRISSA